VTAIVRGHARRAPAPDGGTALSVLAELPGKGAIIPSGTEARWACTYLLSRTVPVLGR
jgi:hypothetical protein